MMTVVLCSRRMYVTISVQLKEAPLLDLLLINYYVLILKLYEEKGFSIYKY